MLGDGTYKEMNAVSLLDNQFNTELERLLLSYKEALRARISDCRMFLNSMNALHCFAAFLDINNIEI